MALEPPKVFLMIYIKSKHFPKGYLFVPLHIFFENQKGKHLKWAI